MDVTNRALRFVNLLPHPTLPKVERKQALTSDLSTSNGVAQRAKADVVSEHDQQAMERRRAEALRGFFPKVFTWLARRWDLDGISEVNSYLSQASDLDDLERRIRRLEQRRHFSG